MKFKQYLNETIFTVTANTKTKKQTAKISLMVSAKNEKEAEKSFKETTASQIKNGSLPKDTKILNIKVKKGL